MTTNNQKMLREIANDTITPKKRDFKVQNDLYEKKNDNDFYEGQDFDDECYGCLLYTSPSPRDRTRSRMPSSA